MKAFQTVWSHTCNNAPPHDNAMRWSTSTKSVHYTGKAHVWYGNHTFKIRYHMFIYRAHFSYKVFFHIYFYLMLTLCTQVNVITTSTMSFTNHYQYSWINCLIHGLWVISKAIYKYLLLLLILHAWYCMNGEYRHHVCSTC